MASRPSFNPNRPSEVPADAWRNLAVSAVFEPGSTFKPFVVGWAMHQDSLKRSDTIQCFNGAYRMGHRILHDHHSYYSLSVEDVLVKSSNIGMARIAERIGLQQLYECTVAFGFGRRTGIETEPPVPTRRHMRMLVTRPTRLHPTGRIRLTLWMNVRPSVRDSFT